MWHSCLDHRDIGSTKCVGILELWPSQSLFLASGSWWKEGLFGWPFFFAWPDQALKRPSWLESFSIVWPIRGLKGQPVWGLSLLFSCWCWYVGERGYSVGFLPCTWLNSITLPSWLPGFPTQSFPTMISSFMSPWDISLQPTADLTLGFALQSLHSSSQLLRFLGDLHLCPRYV